MVISPIECPNAIVGLTLHCSLPSLSLSHPQLLRVWCQRAPAADLHQFIRECGFHLLGNQLHAHPATAALLEASRRLVVVSPSGRGPVQQVQAGALTLLLSLLPASTADISLCHNIITYLEYIVTEVSAADTTGSAGDGGSTGLAGIQWVCEREHEWPNR